MGAQRDYRRLGLGLRLIEHAARWARDNGLAWIDLQVLSVNQPAIALYRRAGFIQTGGLRQPPTPEGVPVTMMSPGSSVMPWVM